MNFGKSGNFEQFRQTVGQRERAREQAVACIGRARIDSGRCVPEEPLINQTATEIPYRSGDRSAAARHAAHFAQGRTRVWHKIENQLRDRGGKCAVGVMQRRGVADLKFGLQTFALGARESDIGLGDIDADNFPRRPAPGHGARKTPGAGADIEQSAFRRQ